MPLWLPFLVVSVVAVTLLVLPLVRGGRGRAMVRRGDYDLTVFRDQLAEVDRDVERGLLTLDQAEAARVEVQRRLLAAAADTEEAASATGSTTINRLIAATVLVVVPLGALVLYLSVGSPGVPDHPFASREDPAIARQAGAMDEAISRLRARLKTTPDDADGWVLLAHSLLSRERFEEARDAYATAHRLIPGDGDVAADYGESQVLVADGMVTPEAHDLFTRALAASPDNPKPRFYLGLEKEQKGDGRGALRMWVDLVALSPADAPWLPLVRQQIVETSGALGIDPVTIEPSVEARALAPAPSPAPAPPSSREDVAKALDDMSEADRDALIRSMVEQLAERLRQFPDDLDGWLRLGRSYQVLGEEDKAREAFARADDLKAKAGGK